jgi:hypothetical protein
LIAYVNSFDATQELFATAYGAKADRSNATGAAMAVIGKLLARQDSNLMLRELSSSDYKYILSENNFAAYSLDGLLRFAGSRGYQNTIGQFLFFLGREVGNIDSYSSSNVPVGLLASLLSGGNPIKLIAILLIYSFQFALFIYAPVTGGGSKDHFRSPGSLMLIVLSGELVCLFQLTPEFGLQVAFVSAGFLLAISLVLRLITLSLPRPANCD